MAMVATDSTIARTNIEAANHSFEQAMRAGDAAKVADNYTDDVHILPPNSPILSGKPAVQAYWQQVIDMGIAAIDMETAEVEFHGDRAWEIGEAVRKTADDQVVDTV